MVSVIIVTYNRDQLLLKTLTSLKNQSFENFECLVIDDGSSVIASDDVFLDARFKFFKRPNHMRKGLASCRNFGLQLAAGTFVHFVDDDDVLHPDFLRFKVDAANRFNADYVISPLKNFEHEVEFSRINCDTKRYSVNWETYILGNSGIYSCSPLWRKYCLENVTFDEALSVSEDWDLYRKLFKSYTNGALVNCQLYFRRIHEETNSSKLRAGRKNELRSYEVTRARAFWEIVENAELNRDLAIFYMRFALKFNNKAIREVLNTANRREGYYTIKDRIAFLKIRLKSSFK